MSKTRLFPIETIVYILFLFFKIKSNFSFRRRNLFVLFYFFFTVRMNSTIEDLPSEIIYNIVKDLSYVDQQSFAKSFEKWKKLVALCFLKPRIKKLANYDKNVRLDISNKGWTEDCLDSDLIIELFDQLQFYKSKYSIPNQIASCAEKFIHLHIFHHYTSSQNCCD